MKLRAVLAGVDGSPESAHAASFAVRLAARAGAECRLVLAVADYGPGFSLPEAGIRVDAMNEAAASAARGLVEYALDGVVTPAVLRTLAVRVGRAPAVLADEAERHRAGIVVLGAKRHGTLARIGGSTITNLVRISSVPVLALERPTTTLRRVLAAVDLSNAAEPTIRAAEDIAALFDAEVRLMHSAEPMPVVPGYRMAVTADDFYRRTVAGVEETIRPLLRGPRSELVIRRGRAAAAIATEATRWQADLVVVGSHGKGWVDRLLLGSTSERLLQLLPAPTLVIPMTRLASEAEATVAR